MRTHTYDDANDFTFLMGDIQRGRNGKCPSRAMEYIHRIKRGSFLEDLFSFSKHFGHGKTRISESIRIARRHDKDYGNWYY